MCNELQQLEREVQLREERQARMRALQAELSRKEDEQRLLVLAEVDSDAKLLQRVLTSEASTHEIKAAAFAAYIEAWKVPADGVQTKDGFVVDWRRYEDLRGLHEMGVVSDSMIGVAWELVCQRYGVTCAEAPADLVWQGGTAAGAFGHVAWQPTAAMIAQQKARAKKRKSMAWSIVKVVLWAIGLALAGFLAYWVVRVLYWLLLQLIDGIGSLLSNCWVWIVIGVVLLGLFGNKDK
jgi:hypothetical protein